MTSPRQQCLDLIAEYDAEFEEYGHNRQLIAGAYTPTGIVWAATQCHTLAVQFLTNRSEGWASLLDDLLAGVEACDDPDCETCHPEVTP